MKQTPNKWLIIKIDNVGDIFYKVFGTWSGGYLEGDSWRLNSGIDKTVYHEDSYEFQGNSGSVYICGKGGYGIAGASNYAVLETLLEKGNSIEGVSMTVLEEGDMLKWLQ